MARCFGLGSLLAAFILILGSASAQQDDKKRNGEVLFAKLDVNKDHKLTKDEFVKLADYAKEKTKAKDFLGSVFDKLDSDKKGQVTKEQFLKYLDQAKKKKDTSG